MTSDAALFIDANQYLKLCEMVDGASFLIGSKRFRAYRASPARALERAVSLAALAARWNDTVCTVRAPRAPAA
jgi:hypothetical protein